MTGLALKLGREEHWRLRRQCSSYLHRAAAVILSNAKDPEVKDPEAKDPVKELAHILLSPSMTKPFFCRTFAPHTGLTGFDSGQKRYASMPGFDRTARQQRRSKHNWRK